MSDSTYDYTFVCDALQALVPDQDILVTQWRGTEAVSQLYRFEITVAVHGADLALETLLDQSATLRLRLPDGATARWHGIVTQGSQYGHDDSYDYYQLVLEPRLARLGLRQWSEIYLDQQLDDLITTLLNEGRLTEKYHSDDAPYDYRIAVTDQDLASMRRPFVCQFDESCLDFLMRKLEFYGVYFWFEQGDDREAIVFGNDAGRQPGQADSAIYYPKGALDPDIRQIVVTRMDRSVTMRPATVSLRALHDQDNTRLSMHSDAPVPSIAASEGEVQSVADHFSVVDGSSDSDSNGVSGETLAKWRAQEAACQGLIVRGEARTPGVMTGRFLAVSEFQRQADAAQYQYYVFKVEHEGVQTLETSPSSDEPPYLARFTALPRWRDQTNQADPVQFRPQRITPIPRVSRLMTGFVDMDAQAGPKRYAQPDDQGRYKVRLPFARNDHGGYRNSAWLRLSTPYAAGSGNTALAKSGMHFPLREGTEVLVAFLNGDPDLPVIVGTLPNAEAPSVVSQKNSREHVIRTPGGSGMVILDGGGSVTAGTQDAEGDDANQPESYVDDGSSVTITSPTTNAVLNLGAATAAASPAPDGFALKSNTNGTIVAGEYMLIEVPGHYRMCAGASVDSEGNQDGDTQSNFLGSSANLAPGVNASQSGGVVISNFTGAKFESAESFTVEATVGAATSVFAGIKFDSMFGGSVNTHFAGTQEFNLRRKKYLSNGDERIATNVVTKFLKKTGLSGEYSQKSLTHSITAIRSYDVTSPDLTLSAGTSGLAMSTGSVSLYSPFGETDVSGNEAAITGSVSTTVVGGKGNQLKLGVGVELKSATTLDLRSTANATINGPLIRIG
ncbi:MAG: type VI secretion system Vgr family protein [Alcaligenaceae bacterium]|nr:type VI secretion system Vgr family protein [Alcaligenaceae bacterium]